LRGPDQQGGDFGERIIKNNLLFTFLRTFRRKKLIHL